jgi:hypothetical protein
MTTVVVVRSDSDEQREQFRLLMTRYLQSRPVDAPRDDMRSREQIMRDIDNKTRLMHHRS